ncbi:MAG: C40 family peptidase [Chloroflexia bacterium]|nr:C40 family peptidase [Chloroflexia bacterium]
MSGMVITAIPAGSTVAVRGAAANGWQPVTCAGRAGYVTSDFVSASTGSVTPTPTPSNPGSGSGQTGTAVVSTGGGGLYCRTAPGGSTITIVANGTTVGTRGASSNGWTPVVCGGMNGFMSSEFLSTGGGGTTNPTPTPAPDTDSGSGSAMKSGDNGKVNTRANMRYSALMSANVVVIVDAGEVLRITGNSTNGFYPVSYDGLNGFMATELLTKTSEALSERGGSGSEPEPQPSPGGGGSTATGNAIANYAMRYVGYPYVWATAGPSSFDCSGFTNWVIKNVVGPDIGRGLWTQWASGVAINRADLQPGDLVFFQNTYKAGLSHSGIYIGNNQFVHAENPNTGVRVSDLNSNYYGSRWLGARRIN